MLPPRTHHLIRTNSLSVINTPSPIILHRARSPDQELPIIRLRDGEAINVPADVLASVQVAIGRRIHGAKVQPVPARGIGDERRKADVAEGGHDDAGQGGLVEAVEVRVGGRLVDADGPEVGAGAGDVGPVGVEVLRDGEFALADDGPVDGGGRVDVDVDPAGDVARVC